MDLTIRTSTGKLTKRSKTRIASAAVMLRGMITQGLTYDQALHALTVGPFARFPSLTVEEIYLARADLLSFPLLFPTK